MVVTQGTVQIMGSGKWTMTFDELYEKLEQFVHYLGHTKANGAALMDHDEISGELFEEMVKGYARYSHLPEEELLAVVKRMFDNRISELTYKYYVTHRKAALNPANMPTDNNEEDQWRNGFSITWQSCAEFDLDELIESKDRVRATYEALSPDAQVVFRAVIHDNPQIARQLLLSGLRASYVYDNGKVRVIKPWQVAESLIMKEKDVRKAFGEIKRVYAEVMNEV